MNTYSMDTYCTVMLSMDTYCTVMLSMDTYSTVMLSLSVYDDVCLVGSMMGTIDTGFDYHANMVYVLQDNLINLF